MRYPIRVAAPLRPLFALFGFKAAESFVELDNGSLRFRYGTADETVALEDVDRVEPRRWPLIFGLGAKLDVKGGVAYVSSSQGVVRIWLKRPYPMNVWGPFRRSQTHAVTVSLEDPEGFIAAVEAARRGG